MCYWWNSSYTIFFDRPSSTLLVPNRVYTKTLESSKILCKGMQVFPKYVIEKDINFHVQQKVKVKMYIAVVWLFLYFSFFVFLFLIFTFFFTLKRFVGSLHLFEEDLFWFLRRTLYNTWKNNKSNRNSHLRCSIKKGVLKNFAEHFWVSASETISTSSNNF